MPRGKLPTWRVAELLRLAPRQTSAAGSGVPAWQNLRYASGDTVVPATIVKLLEWCLIGGGGEEALILLAFLQPNYLERGDLERYLVQSTIRTSSTK